MTLTQHGKTEDGKKYFFEILVDEAEFEAALQKAYKKEVKRIKVDGFRDGKAPRAIIERMYGENVFFDTAVDEILPDSYADCMKQVDIDVVDRPSVDIKEVTKQGFTARFEVVLRPELKVKKYKGVSAKKVVEPVGDEKIEQELKDIQFKQSRLESVTDRPARDQDIVSIDFEGFVDGVAFDGGKAEKYSLTLGSHQFIEGFEEQIIGKNVGDEFDVNVRFPKEYGAAELADKEAVFKVKLHEIRFRELPEINDELANDVDFDTLDALKTDIKERLEKAAEEKADAEFENELADKIIAELEGEVPEVMITNRIDDLVGDFEYSMSRQGLRLEDYLKYTGSTVEQFRDSYKEQAERQIKMRLALEAIARAENFEVTPEEVEQEYAKMCEKHKIELDKLKNYVSEKELRGDIVCTKALDFVRDNAKQTKK